MHDDDYISEIVGDISKDPEVIIIPELLIHGNAARAWQSGWGVSNYGMSGYHWYDFPICGVQNKDGNIMNMIHRAYKDDDKKYAPNGGHSGGNPGIVMYLKMKDFKIEPSGTRGKKNLSCVVADAYIRSFLGPKGKYGRRDAREAWWPMYGNSASPERKHTPKWFFGNSPSTRRQDWIDICNKMKKQRHNCNPSNRALCDSFTCGFTIYYDIIIDSKVAKWGELIKRPPGKHPQDEHWTEPLRRVKKKKIVASDITLNEDTRILFALRNNSQCSCDQTNKNMPIFAVEITHMFRKNPYVWRRFGYRDNSHGAEFKDTEGINISNRLGEDLCDGKWHLVDPLYYKEGNKWSSVDREDS